MTYDGLLPYLIEAMKEQQSEIERLKDRGTAITDFGSERLSSASIWIEYDSDFSSIIEAGRLPAISITSNKFGVELIVTEKSGSGFRVAQQGSDIVSFDWLATAKVDRIPSVKRDLEAERLNNEKVEAMKNRLQKHFKAHQKLTDDEVKEEMLKGRKRLPDDLPDPVLTATDSTKWQDPAISTVDPDFWKTDPLVDPEYMKMKQEQRRC